MIKTIRYLRLQTREFAREAIAKRPALFHAIYYLTGARKKVFITHKTDIVIEGYPRSANTFAVHAFRVSNPEAVIANHIHNPAHALWGVRKNKPTVILIRNPEDAIKSLVIRSPQLPVEFAIKRYVNFYYPFQMHLDKIILADFGTVTNDFNKVIMMVNHKYKTNFTSFDPARHLASVLNGIDAENSKKHGGNPSVEQVPRPHRHRAKLKEGVSLDDHQNLLDEAKKLYERLRKVAI